MPSHLQAQLLALYADATYCDYSQQPLMHYNPQYNGKVFNQVEIKPEVRRLIPTDIGTDSLLRVYADDWLLPRRILNVIQASRTRSSRNWIHDVVSLHPTQVDQRERAMYHDSGDARCTLLGNAI